METARSLLRRRSRRPGRNRGRRSRIRFRAPCLLTVAEGIEVGVLEGGLDCLTVIQSISAVETRASIFLAFYITGIHTIARRWLPVRDSLLRTAD